ncbi:MAG: aldehyde dehydrogenase family protein, partial [Pseudomonadales bacterium]
MDTTVEQYISRYGVTEQSHAFLQQQQRMYINGEFLAASDGATMPVLEPCTEGILAEVPSATSADIDRAVRAARQSFDEGEWSQWKPVQRERVLHRLADLIEENLQTLAEIEALDAGKAIEGCKAVDMAGSVDLLRYMAGWATKIDGATRPVSVEGDHFAYTLKEPVGVVGAIVPWNWPFNMAIWKLAAPLAVGCTLVLKPAQLTPLSMLFFAQLCQQAGLPKGVLNIVTGRGSTIGNDLVNHPGINKVSFTGSTDVGKTVGKAAIENINHVTLELGGKSPMVVFEDANIHRVVDATQQSIFFNTGQVCSAGSRIYIQRAVYEEVLTAIAKRAEAMQIGATLDSNTEMGPAISAAQKQTVMSYIEIGKQEGARLVCGGENPGGEGYFVQPTLFADCTNDMRIVQEEIFGPVLVAIPFDTEEEALALANDNIYGLTASVFTRDISRAHRIVPKLEAGTVWVNTHDMIDANTPFGGVKQSGIGKDMGPEQLDYFLETKAVWIAL